MFYLSGAINVSLFLIIRPILLLFPRPEELDGEHSPDPTSAASEDGGPRDSTAPSHVNSIGLHVDV
jgi:hypothetical protein